MDRTQVIMATAVMDVSEGSKRHAATRESGNEEETLRGHDDRINEKDRCANTSPLQQSSIVWAFGVRSVSRQTA
jgi:hypothetical protein